MSGKIEIKIYRFDPEVDEESRWDTYEIETYPSMSILDALYDILRLKDSSISFRCSCRIGMCGSCAMIINGTEGLACRTQVSTVGNKVSVRPLNNLPVIKDLATNMDNFFEKYKSIMPWYIGNTEEVAKILPGSSERGIIDAQLDCITCGACYSACSMVTFDKKYLGPAALNRAYNLLADNRDVAFEDRLERVDHEHGIWRCHTQFDCAEVCIKKISPTWSIQQIKNEAVLQDMKRIFKKKDRKEEYSHGKAKSSGY